MATLSIVSVTPNDHVLPVTAAIQIRFSRNSTTFNNVRVRIAKNGSITSGNVAVIDVTSSTTFNGADGRTVLTYGKLTSQGGVEEGVTYSLDITCFDTAPTVFDWTRVTTFAPYRRPTISDFVPAINAELGGYPIVCSWVVDPGGADGVLKSQSIEITDITDAAAPSSVYYKDVDPALREVSLSVADVQLFSDRSYRFTLRPVNDVGLMNVLYHDVTTHWEPPAEPTASVEVESSSMCAEVTVHEGQGSAAEVQSLMLVRVNPDGTRFVMADELNDGDVVMDPLAPLGTDYSYEVTATDSNGSTSVGTVDAKIGTRYWAINFGQSAGESVLLRYGQRLKRSPSRGGELMHFADGGAGGGLPVFYPTADRDESVTFEFWLRSADDADSLIDLCQRYSVGWLRDQYGHRWKGVIEVTIDYDSWGVTFKVSATLNAVRFEEAR